MPDSYYYADAPERFPMRIALLQVNTAPGDFSGNVALIANQARKALALVRRALWGLGRFSLGRHGPPGRFL